MPDVVHGRDGWTPDWIEAHRRAMAGIDAAQKAARLGQLATVRTKLGLVEIALRAMAPGGA